ncbi:MAG TPA: CheR family methyltransferase [Polyangia bacterium]|jgi:chemotaxis protein methyltransferase CheR|nr:CheR family methyltransferase [Polyangia bacterium]
MGGDDAAELADARHLAAVTRDRIGLKPTLSAPKIEALLRGMPADRRGGFCRNLISSAPDAAAWQAFTETLLVHETYFFRHPDQLRLLAEMLLPRLLQQRLDSGSRAVRIWCAGCSSGEEVYTIALLLQAAIAASAVPSLGAWNATVLGTDLSAPTLQMARAGTYALVAGLNSFRDVPDFARHHFADVLSATQTSWSADAELRHMTRFVQHNLVTDPPALRDVDLILCRNTFIYFDEAQSRSALASLEAALRPAGALLMGPAETASDASGLSMVCAEQAVFWVKEAAR